ncbi:MAG: thioredoxin [Rickettsiales bacterium]
MANNVTDSSFDKDVLKSALPVLVDFWAEWCGPCRQLSPVVDEIATDLEGTLKVVKINIDENPDVPTKYNVRGIPTLILFKNGAPAATKVGALPKSAILQWLESYVETAA